MSQSFHNNHNGLDSAFSYKPYIIVNNNLVRLKQKLHKKASSDKCYNDFFCSHKTCLLLLHLLAVKMTYRKKKTLIEKKKKKKMTYNERDVEWSPNSFSHSESYHLRPQLCHKRYFKVYLSCDISDINKQKRTNLIYNHLPSKNKAL